jgi:hypothetical protein
MPSGPLRRHDHAGIHPLLFSSWVGPGCSFWLRGEWRCSAEEGIGRLCPSDHHRRTCRNNTRRFAVRSATRRRRQAEIEGAITIKAAAEYAEWTEGRGNYLMRFPRIPAVLRVLRGCFCRWGNRPRSATHRHPALQLQRTAPALQRCPVSKGTMPPHRRPA